MKRTLLWIVILVILFATFPGTVLKAETLPPCCKKETAKEKTHSSTRTQAYSQLEIIEVKFKEGKIVVKGVTDLPDGSRLSVFIAEEGRELATLSRNCEVIEGTFSAFLTPPLEWKGSYRFLNVKVLFDPHRQTPSIAKQTGNNGENLQGEKIIVQGKSKFLVTQGVVTLEF